MYQGTTHKAGPLSGPRRVQFNRDLLSWRPMRGADRGLHRFSCAAKAFNQIL